MEGGARGDFLLLQGPNDDTMHVHENQASYDKILLKSDFLHHHDACDPHPDLLLMDANDEAKFFPMLLFHSTPAITSPKPPSGTPGHGGPYEGGDDCRLFDSEFSVGGRTQNGLFTNDQLFPDAESPAVDMLPDGKAFWINLAESPDSLQCNLFNPLSLTTAGETAAERNRKHSHGGVADLTG